MLSSSDANEKTLVSALSGAPHVSMGPSINVAAVQVESAFPDDKVEGVFGTRTTWHWRNLDAVRCRIDKAIRVIRTICDTYQPLNVVVFPEYTIPVAQALPAFVDIAREKRLLIVCGSDNVLGQPGEPVYNRCPLVLPNGDVHWVGKKHVSGIELEHVDPAEADGHDGFVVMDGGGAQQWMKVCICLDCVDLISKEHGDLPGPGLFIVPMSTPRVSNFWPHADAMLSSKAGRAVLFCNATGKATQGRSALFIVSHLKTSQEPHHPTVELPAGAEAVAIYQLDLRQLPLPKKTPIWGARQALARHAIFRLQDTGTSTKLVPIEQPQAPRVRAIVNPALFDRLAKKIRIGFLQATSLSRIQEPLGGKPGFETYYVMGHHDIIITHLSHEETGMKYDIASFFPEVSTTPWVFPGLDAASDEKKKGGVPEYQHFEVEKTFKVLGHRIDERNYALPYPTSQQLSKIVRLGDNWDSEDVTPAERDEYLRKGWILDKTKYTPGEIDVVMTMFLPYIDLTGVRPLFEATVLQYLIEAEWITSIFRGSTKYGLSAHYVLRISAPLEQLASLISDIHTRAYAAKVLVRTGTYVIIRKASRLSLEALLIPELSADDETYRAGEVLPHLEPSDRSLVLNMDKAAQEELLSRFKQLGASVDTAAEACRSIRTDAARLKDEILAGLVRQDFTRLARPHSILLSPVEQHLQSLIDTVIPGDYLDANRQRLNLAPGRQRSNLTYSEKIRVLCQAIEDRLPGAADLPLAALRTLYDKTKDVRNQIIHSDWAPLTLDSYAAAIASYCSFISTFSGSMEGCGEPDAATAG